MTWKTENESKLYLLNLKFAARVRALLAQLESEGIPVLVTQGLRTWAQQDALYAKGRTTPGPIVTRARGGHSQHNFGLAVDVAPDDIYQAGLQLDWNVAHPAWKRILEVAPKFDLAEGAEWRTFPDNPHLYPSEIPATCALLIEKYAVRGLLDVWEWFDSLAPVTI
jgi:peptidoglycan LD-endopeptidase CwlK